MTESIDDFWAQERAREESQRGRQADPGACGTCRDWVQEGEQVEHDECAQRATLLKAPDHPGYELITGLSEEELAALPPRFHVPVFLDTAQPQSWVCAVCWGDGWGSAWPCATAVKHGDRVFTDEHQAETTQKKLLAELDAVRSEAARFGIYGAPAAATKALAARASELVDENAALRGRVDELEARIERRRTRLVNAENDLLNIRGALSPNGFPRRVPMEIDERVAPAVEWLLGEVERLNTELADLTARSRRVADSFRWFIEESSDPGTEALAAQYELVNKLSALRGGEDLPLSPVETALRSVLALLDETQDDATAGEIRAVIAKALPCEDMSDRRRRLYLDGKGNAWIDCAADESGVRYVIEVDEAIGEEKPVDEVREATGSLRGIGRCW